MGHFISEGAVKNQNKEDRSCQSIRGLHEEAQYKVSPSSPSLVVVLFWNAGEGSDGLLKVSYS